MDTNQHKPTSSILSEKELRRYLHQINIPEIGIAGQERLKQSKVLVVGAGGKGASILENLAVAGIGKIGISDYRHVEERGLSLQHLYGNSDLGKQKAIISREKLRELNPLIEYQLHNVKLSAQNIDVICEPYQLIIGATNNMEVHKLIGNKNKKGIFMQVQGSQIVVGIYNYRGGPKLENISNHLSDLNKEPNDGAWACRVSANNMLASVVSMETVKILLGLDTILNGNILRLEMKDYSIAIDEVKQVIIKHTR